MPPVLPEQPPFAFQAGILPLKDPDAGPTAMPTEVVCCDRYLGKEL